MADGALLPDDPDEYTHYLYRADALLFSVDLELQSIFAEHNRPKGQVGSDVGGDDYSDSGGDTEDDEDMCCYHAHYTVGEVDDLVDVWMRSRMFGDPQAIRTLVAFAYGVIKVLAEQYPTEERDY